MPRSSTLAALTAFLLLIHAVSAQYPSCFYEQQDEIEVNLARAVTYLKEAGYRVEFGNLTFPNPCSNESKSCHGNNPLSPYGLYGFPGDIGDDQGYYQLGYQEAIIFYGCTPPVSRYYGFQTYVFLSDDKILNADLGDAVNMDIVNTSQSQYVYDTQWLITTSADPTTRNDAEAAFARAGVPASLFNTDIIPNVTEIGLAPMGHGVDDTVFNTLFRVAACANKSFCQDYFNRNWTIIRITPIIPHADVSFGVPAYKNRSIAVPEFYLRSELEGLAHAVTKAHVNSNTVLRDNFTLSARTEDGLQCIAQASNCQDETRDAAYQIMDAVFLLKDGPNDVAVAVGVIHSLTPSPSATYTSMTLYGLPKTNGIVGVLDTAMTGSAAQYGFPQPYLYAYSFKRNCTDIPFCFEVPTVFPGVSLENFMTVSERAYLDPTTKVGPDPTQVLSPHLLNFATKINE